MSLRAYSLDTGTKGAACTICNFELGHLVLFHVFKHPRSHTFGYRIGGHSCLDIVEKMGEVNDITGFLREGFCAKPLKAFLW